MMIDDITAPAIALRDAPSIPGLTFRRFRGESDFPKMLAVIDGSKREDGLERAQTIDEITRYYSHLKNCDPYRDMIFAEVDGRVAGYGRAWWEQENSGTRLYAHFGFLLPEWRRKGIGRTMLRFLQSRLTEIAADQAYEGPAAFQSFVAETQVAAEALLKADGYTAARHFFDMLRPNLDDIPDLPLPEGLEVRPVHPEQLPAIWAANAEAFRDHWGYVEPNAEDYAGWLDGPEYQPEIWKVAWDIETNQVAGMVLGFIFHKENEEYQRLRGYTENICVRRPWRKRGLARALVVENLRELKARGMTEAALGVDTENLPGALRVYESVGFRAVKRSSAYRKPLR